MSDFVLMCQDLKKTFHDGERELEILKGIDFAVNARESAAILGASGSGKSTLLHLLGGLDQPTEGKIFWSGTRIAHMSEAKKCRMRNQHLGFVYQFHHLLPEFTTIENVAMPLLIGGASTKKAKSEAKVFLKRVGLGDRLLHKVGKLSGGERQRAAIARALVTQPKCVLADEPTGNLDRKSAKEVLDVILTLQSSVGTSFVVVTHDSALAGSMGACYRLENGLLQSFHNICPVDDE